MSASARSRHRRKGVGQITGIVDLHEVRCHAELLGHGRCLSHGQRGACKRGIVEDGDA